MKNNKLLQLLASLGPAEMEALEAFVSAAYFNKDETTRRLFGYLKAHYPDFPPDQVEKKRVFHHLFAQQPYDDKQLRYLMSGLNKLAERFLTIQKLEEKPQQSALLLLETLSQRGLEKNYRGVNRQIEQMLETQPDGDDFFLFQFQWASLREQHFERQRLRRFDENIQIASAQLDRYYFLHRLRIACAMLDRQTILQAKYELNLTTDWIRHLESRLYFQEPVIRLYYTIYQALSDETDESHFERLLSGITTDAERVPFGDLRDIYLFAINYCARKIRQGKDAYANAALTLYHDGLKSGILIENGILSPWTFTNVVKLSLRLQHYEKIEPFIAQYAPLLPASFRENAMYYNLAELYYYTRRYEEAQENLQKVAFSDPNYYLGARVILAKIFYETSAEEPLLSLLAAFTVFLRRNKELSNSLKHTYLNFCKILFQIITRPPSRLSPILQKIKTTELLTDRAWLEQTCKTVMIG